MEGKAGGFGGSRLVYPNRDGYIESSSSGSVLSSEHYESVEEITPEERFLQREIFRALMIQNGENEQPPEPDEDSPFMERRDQIYIPAASTTNKTESASSSTIEANGSPSNNHPEDEMEGLLWDHQFQAQVATIRKIQQQETPLEKKIKAYSDMSSLTSDFIHTACTYGNNPPRTRSPFYSVYTCHTTTRR